jgi:hypothetical protein
VFTHPRKLAFRSEVEEIGVEVPLVLEVLVAAALGD